MSVFCIIPIIGFLNPSINKKPNVNFKYYGDIAPIGYFDPLNFSNYKNTQYLREFELQHGRVAMIAATILPLYEVFNKDSLGISFLSNMKYEDQLPFWVLMFLIEFRRMQMGWKNPFKNETLFSLKENFQPGNYLNLNANNIDKRLYNSEISNGRLAMLASAHIIGSELLTQTSLF